MTGELCLVLLKQSHTLLNKSVSDFTQKAKWHFKVKSVRGGAVHDDRLCGVCLFQRRLALKHTLADLLTCRLLLLAEGQLAGLEQRYFGALCCVMWSCSSALLQLPCRSNRIGGRLKIPPNKKQPQQQRRRDATMPTEYLCFSSN